MSCPLFCQCGLTLKVVWNRSVCLFQTQFLNPFLCVANWILKDFVGLQGCGPDLAPIKLLPLLKMIAQGPNLEVWELHRGYNGARLH